MKVYYVEMVRRGSRPREWAGWVVCLPEGMATTHHAAQEVERAYKVPAGWTVGKVIELPMRMVGAWQVEGSVEVEARS